MPNTNKINAWKLFLYIRVTNKNNKYVQNF